MQLSKDELTMKMNTVRVNRVSIFPSFFGFILFLGILYGIYYFARKFGIPYIGTIAKWGLIGVLGIVSFVILIFLLILLVFVIVLTFVFFKNKKLQKQIKKRRDAQKIKILNSSKNKKTSNKNKKSKGPVIVDAQYK